MTQIHEVETLNTLSDTITQRQIIRFTRFKLYSSRGAFQKKAIILLLKFPWFVQVDHVRAPKTIYEQSSESRKLHQMLHE